MQIIEAAMRKLVHLVYGILKSSRPFAPTSSPLPLDFQDSIYAPQPLHPWNRAQTHSHQDDGAWA